LTTVWGSEYDPATLSWAAAERLTDTAEEAANPAVGFTASQLVVLYPRRPSGGNYDIYMRRKALAGDEYVYGYDRLYRLTAVTGPDGPRSYTYDPAGNRLTRVSGTSTAYIYDRADRVTSAGATSITVDANGNLRAKGADAFVFDQANRLTSATVTGSTETYVYDGDGRRFSRQLGANPAIRYKSDTTGDLAATLDDGSRKFVYGVGLAYAVSGTSIEVYHTDRLGSVRALTTAAGTVTATYRSDEWGRPTASTGSSGQPYGFTGEPRDATGLTYLRTRYYDSDLGRFMSRDTWPGVPTAGQTQNRYAYATDNPLLASDRNGRFLDVILDAAFIVYDVGSLIFGPEKDRGMNLLGLGADVLSLFIPFVTGGGAAVRAGTHAAEHADEVVDVGRWFEDAGKAVCSFTPDTLVATPDGAVPIRSIKVGQVVLAWDEASRTVVRRPVTAVLSHADDEITRVTIDGIVIVTTPNHPFLTVEAGWVEAGLLWHGAHVGTAKGPGVVGYVSTTSYSGTLWNLTVKSAHTFFVGERQVLVHNSCPADEINSTLDRIKRGEKYEHANDGISFENREGFLPQRPSGYYKEYVHPTPGVAGPGTQRIIVGADGDVWFTPDHYETFVRIQ
jgi:RHS repeat-associated protein